MQYMTWREVHTRACTFAYSPSTACLAATKGAGSRDRKNGQGTCGLDQDGIEAGLAPQELGEHFDEVAPHCRHCQAWEVEQKGKTGCCTVRN